MTAGANIGCVTAGRSDKWAYAALEVPASSIYRVLNLTLGL